MDEPMAGDAKHLKGFPWRYGVGRAGSTAVKRSLFNSGVGHNNWLSVQIFDLNRRDPAEPLSDQAPGRSLVYTDADPTVHLSNFKISKFP